MKKWPYDECATILIQEQNLSIIEYPADEE